jgi:hypothetical protein
VPHSAARRPRLRPLGDPTLLHAGVALTARAARPPPGLRLGEPAAAAAGAGAAAENALPLLGASEQLRARFGAAQGPRARLASAGQLADCGSAGDCAGHRPA